jgi:hypothetical protein
LVPENAEKPTILLKVQSLMNPIISWQRWGPLLGQTYRFLHVCSRHSQAPARTAQPWSTAALPVKNELRETNVFFRLKTNHAQNDVERLPRCEFQRKNKNRLNNVDTLDSSSTKRLAVTIHLTPSLKRRLRMNSPNDSWYVSLQENVALGHHTVAELPKTSKLFDKINLCLRGGLGWWFGSLGIDDFVNLEKNKNIKPCKQ